MRQRGRRHHQCHRRRDRVDRTARRRACVRRRHRLGRSARHHRFHQRHPLGVEGTSRYPGGLWREVGQRHAAQAVRDLRQYPSGARAAWGTHPVLGPWHRPGGGARERGRPVRRYRAHANPRCGAVPEAHQRQGFREDHPSGLRVRPLRGPHVGGLRHQVEHHETHRGRNEAHVRAHRPRVSRDRGVARHHRQLRAPTGEEARTVRCDRHHQHERRHHQRPPRRPRR